MQTVYGTLQAQTAAVQKRKKAAKKSQDIQQQEGIDLF